MDGNAHHKVYSTSVYIGTSVNVEHCGVSLSDQRKEQHCLWLTKTSPVYY